MRPLPIARLTGLTLAAFALVGARPRHARAQVASASAATPAPARVGRKDLARLRWIVGDWRGEGTAGTVQAPFFERYRFLDDSTLLMEGFADSTFARVTESSRYALRGGRLRSEGSGAQWVAVALDANRVRFAPAAGASNGFSWQRRPGSGARPTEWQAVIESRAADGAVRRRQYRLTRVR